MKKFLFLVLMGILSFNIFAGDEFLTSAKEAFASAKEDKKLVFAVFSGSDWCPPCMQLEKNVFSKEAFFDKLDDEYEFLFLDYPRNLKQREVIKKQNAALAKKYKISGYPTVAVLTPDGEVVFMQSGVPNSSVEAFTVWFEREMKIAKKAFAQAQARKIMEVKSAD